MAIYFPVPVTPNGRHDGSGHHPQWTSPSAYNGLVTYQQSLGHPSYHSPSSHSQQPPHRPQSTAPQQPLTHHWQQQLIKYEASRGAAQPHHRARTSAFTLRNTTKSAIPITNPNAHRAQGSISDRTDASSDEPPREGTPSGTGHPSSTVGPVTSSSPTIAPRPTSSRPKEESTWTTLDMGGMRLKNLSPSLFKLTYLTTLYINHNNLTSIPPAIAQLRNLIHLDLSSNQISSLPSELGMLTSLRELLLFDNMLETLPAQLGTLHQLVMIGLEGNPIHQDYRKTLQEHGTQALIASLRDSCPVPPPPPERLWKHVQPRYPPDLEPTSETFTLLCYNILCERYATSTMYGYTPSWALAWDYRKELILTEVANYEADFLCLQEVDAAQYEEYFMRLLEPQGYDGIFSPKSRARTMSESQRRHVDGCAIFFKKDKYALVERQTIEFNSATHHRREDSRFSGISEDMYNRVFTKDNIAIIALMENRATGSRLIVVNVHVHWDPEFRDVKLIQVAIMMEELEKIGKRFAALSPRLLDGQHGPTGAANGRANGTNGTNGVNGNHSASSTPEPTEPAQPLRKAPSYEDGSRIPTIICGDFNSIPQSGVYEFLVNGTLPPNHEDFMTHKYGKYTDELSDKGGLRHHLSLKSAYNTALGNELPITNYTPSFKGVIDYIWFTNLSLGVEAVLGEVDQAYLDKVVGFPNAHFPSDHVCIISEFRVLKPKDKDQAGQGSTARPIQAFANGRNAQARK
ncbi:Glucose-repressible alcohol dehydrogenase transcriptional effector [Tulasnella sp. UAMH 9824]|nr:Glucose-repressible alcohol dehydrogenase transcriptional effector [Tulasnella sp. UAMH 9824]